MHVGIGFTNKPIRNRASPCASHCASPSRCQRSAPDPQAFVDDVPHALGSRFRRKRSPPWRCRPGCERCCCCAIDALTRQREADVVVLQAIAQLYPQRAGEVIAVISDATRSRCIRCAPCRSQRLPPHRDPRPGRRGQHPRLTEPAATGAAPTNLHGEPVMPSPHGAPPLACGISAYPTHYAAMASQGRIRRAPPPGRSAAVSATARRPCPPPTPSQSLATALRHRLRR